MVEGRGVSPVKAAMGARILKAVAGLPERARTWLARQIRRPLRRPATSPSDRGAP